MSIDDQNPYYETLISFAMNVFGLTDEIGEEDESILKRLFFRFFFVLSGAYSDGYKEVELSEKERYRKMDKVTKAVHTCRLDKSQIEVIETKVLKRSLSRCSICLEDFKIGDDICWSPNGHCTHAFHKACIVEWLMNRNQCPCCRTPYMKTTGEMPSKKQDFVAFD